MRTMKTAILPLLALLLAVAPTGAAAGPLDSRTDSPIDTAESWLDLIDRESYAVGWELAGAGLKGAARKEDWMRTVAAARLHRGPVVARRLAEELATDTAAGLPPGEYMLLSFATAFREIGDSVESLILEREEGGWRVVAYFVR
jgi:hypothetical protein